MSEAKRKQNAVAADPAPATGEVPEQQMKTVIDARLVDDRDVDDKPPRAPDGALEQPAGELWILAELARELTIENGDAHRLEHRPPALQRQRLLVVELGRTQEVALAEHLDGESPVN